MTEPARNGALLAARLLMAASLLPTGIGRGLNVSGFALNLAAAGCPAPNAVASVAVVIQVFGPLALMLGVLPRLTGFAMAAFVAALAVLLHPFWLYAGAGTERDLFLADLGLAGAFLTYALAGPGAWSWQGWRAGAGANARAPAPRSAQGPANGGPKGTPKGAMKGATKAGGRTAEVRRTGGRPARAA